MSTLYSTPRLPSAGVANARIVRAMREHAEIRIVVPVPWYPRFLARRVASLRDLAMAPAVEADIDGSLVRHPRRLHIPRVAYGLQAVLYATSMMAPLRDEVMRFRPAVLLSAWAYPDGTAAVALGKMLGLPVVVRTMGSDINDFAQKPRRRQQIAWALRNADRVIAVSPQLCSMIQDLGVPAQRIAVIPTGVDTARFHPVDREQARRELGLPPGPLIAVPARLSPEKGVHCFVDALACMDRSVRAVLVGDGKQAAALRAQAVRLGLSDRLFFAGFVPEVQMKRYYSAADLVCLPSLQEGWPNALMESMACGCPVVASHVGGVPDIIALTGAGLTAPPGDPVALSQALTSALGRTWDRAACARAMEEHTLDQTARRYLDVCAAVTA